VDVSASEVEVVSIEDAPVAETSVDAGVDSTSDVEVVDVEHSPAIAAEGRADSTSDEVA
jgi:hypothetical protein